MTPNSDLTDVRLDIVVGFPPGKLDIYKKDTVHGFIGRFCEFHRNKWEFSAIPLCVYDSVRN